MSAMIHNARIITPQRIIENGWLLVAQGRIVSLAAGDAPPDSADEYLDAGGQTLLPGFVDIHVHGGAGHDTMDATPDALHEMARFYARHGVTTFLATTWTDTPERIRVAMTQVAQIMQNSSQDGARLAGVHMEGPYLNPEYCGAQNPEYIRQADMAAMQALFDLDVIRLVSLAPEFEANHALIDVCVQRGITVSVAHSGATADQMQQAFARGLSHATHTFNAMTGLHHRRPGIVGAVLTEPTVTAELIADGIHVHPMAMQLLWQMKGPEQVVLITDAIRAAGMPDGEYTIDERVMMVKDGACRLPDGTLAGSILTMESALRNFQAATGDPLETLWQTCSLNPARVIGMAHEIGSIERSKAADLVLLDDNLSVIWTMRAGQLIYRR